MEEKKKPAHMTIGVPRELVAVLNKKRGSFPYAAIIKYMMVKSGFLQLTEDEVGEFKAMERYIEGDE